MPPELAGLVAGDLRGPGLRGPRDLDQERSQKSAGVDLRNGRTGCRPRRAAAPPPAPARIVIQAPSRRAPRPRVRHHPGRRSCGGHGVRSSERWVRQTDFGNAEAVGYLADRLNRIGIEDRLLETRGPGRRRAWPSAAGRRCLRLRPADRHRSGDLQPARRGPAVRRGAARASGAGKERRPSRSTKRRYLGRSGAMRDRRAARRVVVKVGSSSLTTAGGGHRPGADEPLVDVLATAGWPAGRWCSSPPVRSPPDLRRSVCAPGRGTWPPSRPPPRSVRAC